MHQQQRSDVSSPRFVRDMAVKRVLDVGRNRVGGGATRPDAWPATITRERRYYVDAPSPEAESRADRYYQHAHPRSRNDHREHIPRMFLCRSDKNIIFSSLIYVLDVFPAATLEATVRINFGFP